MNLVGELEKLSALHAAGALSAEEFVAAKQKLLASDASEVHYIADDAGEIKGSSAVEFVGEASRPSYVLSGETGRESTRLSRLEARQEIVNLDQKWMIDRESYMVSGRHGSRYIPTAGGSLVTGFVTTAFGIFWTIMVSSIKPMGGGSFGHTPLGTLFPLFGVIFIIGGIGMAIYNMSKASAYQEAEASYRARRAELEREAERT